jgi:hypothetical protein
MFKNLQVLRVNPMDAFNVDCVLGLCPDDGRHRKLKLQADFLRDNFYEAGEAVEMLRTWLNRPEQHSGEIADTVRRSFADVDKDYRIVNSKIQAEPLDVQRVVTLWHKYGGYQALLKFLKTTEEVKSTTTADWLRRMYCPGDLLCVGIDKFGTEIKALEDILALLSLGKRLEYQKMFRFCRYGQLCYLTPATFRSKTIVNIDGKVQGRCNVNVLRRRYFVLEADIAAGEKGWEGILPNALYDGFDLQAAIIRHLFERGYPIVGIVHSGNKSLHVWCSSRGLSEEQIDQKIAYTNSLGVDTHGMTKSQFMRLPNPEHPTRPQPLLYFNPQFVSHE